MKRSAGLICLLALVVLMPALASAQEQAGSLVGIVKDTSGAVLPGVTINVRSPQVVGVTSTTSDTEGRYRFPALPPGVYEVTAELQGFATFKQADVQLALGQVLKLDIALKLGTLTESVEVTAESPIIDVKQNAAAQTVSREIIER